MPILMFWRSRIRRTTAWPWLLGKNADAQVVIVAADAGFDAAVLRPALLGNVDAGHDLQAGDQGREQPLGRVVAFDQSAVNSIADADAILERFDVDVAGPHLDGFFDHQVDQADDRERFRPPR